MSKSIVWLMGFTIGMFMGAAIGVTVTRLMAGA